MSNTTAGLQHKINGARDLFSIVRTMKSVAASSIEQYEKSVHALTDYYRAVELGLSVCFREKRPAPLPVWQKKRVVAGVIVFGSDQGLVGQFNDIAAEFTVKMLTTLPAKPVVWAVGERVHVRLKDAGLPLRGFYNVPNSVKAITPLVEQILVESETRYDKGEITALYLFYNRPASGAVYTTVSQQLLPLDEVWQKELAERPWPTGILPGIIGDSTLALRVFIRGYLFISLFRACAESLSSENSSRLAAMQRAEKNIEELMADLNRKFQRVRQSDIDEELFDVISGFEALSTEKK